MLCLPIFVSALPKCYSNFPINEVVIVFEIAARNVNNHVLYCFTHLLLFKIRIFVTQSTEYNLLFNTQQPSFSPLEDQCIYSYAVKSS